MPIDPLDKIKFNIQNQYLKHLKKIGIDELELSEYRRAQLRRSFFEGFIRCLILLHEDLAEISEQSEDYAIEIFDDMLNQAANHVLQEKGNLN